MYQLCCNYSSYTGNGLLSCLLRQRLVMSTYIHSTISSSKRSEYIPAFLLKCFNSSICYEKQGVSFSQGALAYLRNQSFFYPQNGLRINLPVDCFEAFWNVLWIWKVTIHAMVFLGVFLFLFLFLQNFMHILSYSVLHSFLSLNLFVITNTIGSIKVLLAIMDQVS